MEDDHLSLTRFSHIPILPLTDKKKGSDEQNRQKSFPQIFTACNFGLSQCSQFILSSSKYYSPTIVFPFLCFGIFEVIFFLHLLSFPLTRIIDQACCQCVNVLSVHSYKIINIFPQGYPFWSPLSLCANLSWLLSKPAIAVLLRYSITIIL